MAEGSWNLRCEVDSLSHRCCCRKTKKLLRESESQGRPANKNYEVFFIRLFLFYVIDYCFQTNTGKFLVAPEFFEILQSCVPFSRGIEFLIDAVLLFFLFRKLATSAGKPKVCSAISFIIING